MPKSTKNNKSAITKALIKRMESYVHVETPSHLFGIYVTEFSSLTPDSLHYYLEADRRGMSFWKSLLFDEMRRRDTRLRRICNTRKLNAASKKWILKYGANSVIPESTQQEIISFLYDNYKRIKLSKFLKNIIEAQLHGIRAVELMYNNISGKVMLDKVNYIPNHMMLYDDRVDEYSFLDLTKADALKLRTLGWNITQDRVDISGIKLPPLDPMRLLLIESSEGDSQNGFLNGYANPLIWCYLFKNYGLKDWNIFVEKFANPGVIGKYPPLMGDADRKRLDDAVKNFGRFWKALIPNSASIDLLEDKSKGTTLDLFERYVGYWNKEMTVLVLGESLTLDIGKIGSQCRCGNAL